MARRPARSTACRRGRGSSPTSSTSSSTSSRPTRGRSTGSTSSGATCPRSSRKRSRASYAPMTRLPVMYGIPFRALPPGQAWGLVPAPTHIRSRQRRPRGGGLLVVTCEAGVVLVEVERAVEAEELGVLPEEPARGNLARKELEPLALEGLQVALADPQLALDRVELEPALVSGCPQTGS